MLACDIFPGKTNGDDVLIFYHGGGAHRRAGYQHFAAGLAQAGDISVCLPDIRGHGGSEGPRGHTPSPACAWSDIDAVIAEMRRKFPRGRIYLGGHSSGVGYVLNAFARLAHRREIAELIFLAPEFGFRADTRRAGADFARVRVWAFIINAMSGGHVAGALPAVFFPSRAAGPGAGLLSFYTVNMANAVTPQNPGAQLKAINMPVRIFYAGNDELIDPEKLKKFVAAHAPPACSMAAVPSSHLEIMLDAGPAVAKALASRR
ncbi:MAG: alpha/beta fold hydrolase [Hyphomicrobiales bacterium]|nr:alpha/beta fold hydrolase [Hyphomicrobiales bacterium]